MIRAAAFDNSFVKVSEVAIRLGRVILRGWIFRLIGNYTHGQGQVLTSLDSQKFYDSFNKQTLQQLPVAFDL
jgi:hypothetical protein